MSGIRFKDKVTKSKNFSDTNKRSINVEEHLRMKSFQGRDINIEILDKGRLKRMRLTSVGEDFGFDQEPSSRNFMVNEITFMIIGNSSGSVGFPR